MGSSRLKTHPISILLLLFSSTIRAHFRTLIKRKFELILILALQQTRRHFSAFSTVTSRLVYLDSPKVELISFLQMDLISNTWIMFERCPWIHYLKSMVYIPMQILPKINRKLRQSVERWRNNVEENCSSFSYSITFSWHYPNRRRVEKDERRLLLLMN